MQHPGPSSRSSIGQSADDAPRSYQDGPATIVRIPARESARTTLVVLSILLGAYLLWRLQEVLFLCLLSIMLATAIEPLVNRLRRGPFTRGSGVLVVYGVFVLLITILGFVAVPSLLAQGSALAENLPAQLQTLRPYVDNLQPRALREMVLKTIDHASMMAQSPAPPESEQLTEFGATAVHTIISIITVFVVALYWLLERASFKRALLRMVPARRARDVNIVWLEVEGKLGGWVRGQLILMFAIGVMAAIGYAVIGLPNAVLLGLLAALGEAIPLVGPVLAFAPAVLMALITDPMKALIVVVYAVIIQQIESHVLVPRVMGHMVGISPFTVILGILAGATLYGLLGAFVAVPVAAAVQVILAHVLRMEDPAQAEAHVEVHTPEASQPAPSERGVVS